MDELVGEREDLGRLGVGTVHEHQRSKAVDEGETAELLGMVDESSQRIRPGVTPLARVDLLDHLPLLDVDLLDASHHILRALFEAFRLEVRYHKDDHHALVRAAIAKDTIDYLDTNVIPLFAEQSAKENGRTVNAKRHPGPRDSVSHLCRAPGRSRASPPTGRPVEPAAGAGVRGTGSDWAGGGNPTHIAAM